MRHCTPAGAEASISPETAAKYLGSYESVMYGRVDVRLRKGTLNLDFQSYPTAQLHAKKGEEFTADFGKDVSYMFGLILGARTFTEATFGLDGQGRAVEFRIENMDVFKRIDLAQTACGSIF